MKKDWTYKKLGEVATYVNGYAFKPETWSEKGLPIIRIQNLNNANAAFNYYEGELPEKYIVNKGDLLISWSASLGAYYWEGDIAYLNQHIFKVVFDKSDIIKGFLKYAVEAKLEDMKRKVHGATMQHIVKKDFDNTIIPIPPLSIQRSIVSELDLLHSVIEKKQEQLRALDNLAQSLFYQMFGDPITNPMGWEIKKLGEVAPVKPCQKEIHSENGLFWLLNLDMVESQTGKIIEKNMVTKEEIGNSTTSFSPDNVLYSKLRPYLNKVVLPNNYGYCTTELLPLLPMSGILTREYLCYLLRSNTFVEYINIKVAGAKMPRVTMNDFRNFPLPLPPLSLQQSFAAKVSAIEEQKQAITQSIKDVESLLAQRMDHYFG